MKVYCQAVMTVSVAGLAVVSGARAEDIHSPPASPPPFTALRYDEDYSYLKDPAARTNIFDSLKYVPLNERDGMYLTVGGQLRDRYEYFQNSTFGSGVQDHNGYNLLRAMVNTDLHLGPSMRVFVQGISATVQDRNGGARPSDLDQINLHQAFAEISIPFGRDDSFSVRAGRQVMTFGAQRLIGVSDWTNVRRTFDGVRGTLNTPGNTLDVFYARPVRVLPYDFDDDIPANFITGIYDTLEVPGAWAKKAKTKLDMYAFYVERQSIAFNQASAGEKRYTLGTRLSGSPKPFDFDFEADYQLGRFMGKDTQAFSIAAVGGYTLANAPFSPRVFLGSDIASGGRNGSPGDTFDQLFPSGHDQFGIIDAIGRQNIIDVHPGFTLTLLKNKPAAEQLTCSRSIGSFGARALRTPSTLRREAS
jgi:hypothetical protein